MEWFAFGFNGFGQLIANNEKCASGESTREDVKVTVPINVPCCTFQHEAVTENMAERRRINTLVRASWSRRATLHAGGEGGQVCVSGFGAGAPHQGCCGRSFQESRGYTDAHISEAYLTLAFTDRVECWDLQQNEQKPVWSMEIKTPDQTGHPLAFPLVPGGYIASTPPFFRSLSPHLRALSLVLGAEHAVLQSASGLVYTWGSGSHGQLGHGDLGAQEEPRAVEALWGLPMGSVAAGSWHSACVSAAGGDMYVWGWNESGQLGLPSQALRGRQHKTQHTDASTSTRVQSQEGERSEEVFISIQAFPALLDVTEPCEVTKLSCGSRHTAAVTNTGDLYTWGWGEYGQLGHGTIKSSDEPGRVDFFKDQGLCVVNVVCGPWNTFVCVAKEESNVN